MSMNNIKHDPAFQQFLDKKPNLSDVTKNNYQRGIKLLCEVNNKPFYQIIKEIRSEQNDKIENNMIIRYDPDFGVVYKYLMSVINELLERGNSNVTINNYINNIKVVLSTLKIELPKLPDFPDDTKEWYLLTKQDIGYALNESNLVHKALITFLACTGFRIRDAVNLTVGDFMESTREYHDCDNVYEFLDNAPEGMIGFWSFYPNKTKKHKTICKVCNTPECSDLLMLLLRTRVKYYFDRTIRGNSLLKIEKSDALFGNRKGYFKDHLKPHSISHVFAMKNKKIQMERERNLKKLLNAGELKQREYDDLIRNAPRFHAHGLRKYFISTLAKNCSDLRLCAAMEGHIPPLKHDLSYNKITNEEIKEAYFKAIPDLSFEEVKVKFLVSEEKRKLEEEYDKMKKEKELAEKRYDELKENIDSLAEDVVTTKVQDKLNSILGGMGY